MEGPFLTEIDDRAKIEGSRDPLAIQTIWTRLGRYVIGNLTTITTSAREFTVLMLGYYFAEQLAARGDGDGDLAVFLKWEQLAGYARGIVNNDWEFRGVQRAKINVEEGKVRLGAASHLQILSNQKTYGLWGFFTIPAKSSWLLEGDPVRLTEPARQLVERVYLPLLNRDNRRMMDELMKRLAAEETKINVEARDRPLLEAIAKMLPRKIRSNERQVLRGHLLYGGPQDKTHGGQEVLARAMAEIENDVWQVSPSMIRNLAKNCRSQGETGEFAFAALEKILAAESFLAPAAALFDNLLECDGQTPAEAAGAIKKHLGNALKRIDLNAITQLKPEISGATNDPDMAGRWLRIASAMSDGAYEDCFNLLLEQNRTVMNARSRSSAWAEIKGGKIQVNYKDDEGITLPGRDDLPELWVHPYFINSLRQIAVQLREQGQ